MKTRNWDRDLGKATRSRTDKDFLMKLSKWLFDLSGNVNAAQRLNGIALRRIRECKG